MAIKIITEENMYLNEFMAMMERKSVISVEINRMRISLTAI
jgi:hypothetical protein